MALSAQLTHLPDVLQVTGSGGAVIGAVVAACFRARSPGRFLDQVAAGTAIGSVAGIVVGFGLFIGVELAALAALAATFRGRKIVPMAPSDHALRPTIGRTVRVLAIALSTSVGAGFLLATIGAPLAAFYAFALAFTAAVAMQILAPGAGVRSPLERRDGEPR